MTIVQGFYSACLFLSGFVLSYGAHSLSSRLTPGSCAQEPLLALHSVLTPGCVIRAHFWFCAQTGLTPGSAWGSFLLLCSRSLPDLCLELSSCSVFMTPSVLWPHSCLNSQGLFLVLCSGLTSVSPPPLPLSDLLEQVKRVRPPSIVAAKCRWQVSVPSSLTYAYFCYLSPVAAPVHLMEV